MPVSLPPDVMLPANAKYYSFIESRYAYNPDRDITWSFQFAVSSYNPATQFAFSTFLLPVSSLTNASLSSIPGHYVGVPFDEIYHSMLVTFKVLESISMNGELVKLD